MKEFKGRGLFQATGRVDISQIKGNVKALERLINDIWNNPIDQLILTEGKVYGARYYCVEPVGGNWPDMEEWCFKTYGETSNIWSETKNLTPEPLKRWYMNNRKFWFRDIKDRDWFVLRWNS